jgi:hypothetical protein
MTVYVDDMRAPYGSMVMCHLLADTDDELHTMADKIGVQRKWWQSPARTSGSHYDIALSKRRLAVLHGAVEITLRQAAAMNSRRRVTGQLGKPEDAEAWLAAHRTKPPDSGGDAQAQQQVTQVHHRPGGGAIRGRT